MTSLRMRWSAAVFASLLALLLTWALGTPRYGSPDETSHTVKAYATAHGQLLGSTVSGGDPLIRFYKVPKGLVSGGPCFAHAPDTNAGCAVPFRDSTLELAESAAATYPLPYYAVIGVAARLIGASESVLAYRMISVGLCSLVLAGALLLFRKSFGAHSAIVLLALPPMAVFIVASTNPSGFEVAGTLLLWAFLSRVLTRGSAASRRDLLIASTIGAAVIVVRPVSIPWVAVAFAGYFLLEPRVSNSRTWRRPDLAVASVPITLAVLTGMIWGRLAGVGLSPPAKFIVDISTSRLVRWTIGRTAEIFREAFGTLGWLDTELPTGTYGLWIGVLACAGSAVMFFGDRRTKLLMILLSICWIVYPAAYAMWVSAPGIWQGRYSLPLLGGFATGAMIAVTRARQGVAARQLARLCAGAFIVIEVLAFHQSLRRFMVGANGDLFLRSAGWHPPFSHWILLILNLAAACSLTVLMIIDRPSPTSPWSLGGPVCTPAETTLVLSVISDLTEAQQNRSK